MWWRHKWYKLTERRRAKRLTPEEDATMATNRLGRDLQYIEDNMDSILDNVNAAPKVLNGLERKLQARIKAYEFLGGKIAYQHKKAKALLSDTRKMSDRVHELLAWRDGE